MTPEQFKQARSNLGLSFDKLAAALDMSRRQLIYYEQGEYPVPKAVEMAMRYLLSRK